MAQAGFTLDMEKCTGCKSCTVACRMENNTPTSMYYRWVVDRHRYTVPSAVSDRVKRFVSMACFHCANPACIAACPIPDAITKDTNTGIVLIDQEKCVGCMRCNAACPYGAPQYNANTKKVEKCTLCSHRIAAGLRPACVETCVGRALGYSADVTPGGTPPSEFASTSLTNPSVEF